jgi:hypothetical protein
LSITTKSHIAGYHSVEQQEALEGIGDLGEDFDERNHQDEAKSDRRLGCVRNFATRETIKSKEEVQTKDRKVQAKMIDIKEKRKRGPCQGTEARQATRKRLRIEAREAILASPAPPLAKMTTLRELRLLNLKGA